MKLVASMVTLGALSIPVHASFGEIFTIRTKLLREHKTSADDYTLYDNKGVYVNNFSARAQLSEDQCSSPFCLETTLLQKYETVIYHFDWLAYVGHEPFEITDGGIIKKKDYSIEQSAFRVCHHDAENYLRWDLPHADTPVDCTVPLVLLIADPYSVPEWNSTTSSTSGQGYKRPRSEAQGCSSRALYPTEEQPSSSAETSLFRSYNHTVPISYWEYYGPLELLSDDELQILIDLFEAWKDRDWDEFRGSCKAKIPPEDTEEFSACDDFVKAVLNAYDQPLEAAAKSRCVSLRSCSSWQVITALVMALVFL